MQSELVDPRVRGFLWLHCKGSAQLERLLVRACHPLIVGLCGQGLVRLGVELPRPF